MLLLVFATTFLELNINTLPRFADFVRLSEDPDIGLTKSLPWPYGWLMGQGEVTQNLAVATSLFEVRNKVRDYLNSNNDEQRSAILNDIGDPKVERQPISLDYSMP